MKLKFQDIMSFVNSYQEIQNEKMPLNVAYQLSQISKEISNCISFYQEKYNYYLEQYAEKDSNGNFKMNENKSGVILKKDVALEAQQKFKELDAYEFPIEVKKIPLVAFEKIKLSPSVLTGLLPFIEEDE